ncbi:unnamed protein product [Tuber aestivum]|uniref:Uncharacterized protein n=1 Tax=Tuber aestivum TaxID=59557 RepID=A0A292Q4K8_9PEZI|nr:unnamed protein product [Tuber aestivum]
MAPLEILPGELLIEVGGCLVDLDNISFHDPNSLAPTLRRFALKNLYLIHWAAAEGHHHLVKLLLDAEVEVDRQTPNRRTPLQAAAYSGKLEVMTYLPYRGADVSAH